jgi:hypothetical protein
MGQTKKKSLTLARNLARASRIRVLCKKPETLGGLSLAALSWGA